MGKQQIVAELNVNVDECGDHDVVHDMRHGGLALNIG